MNRKDVKRSNHVIIINLIRTYAGGTEEKCGNLRTIGVPNENRTADFLTTKQN
jgi:hypothetical protein